jgi:two-component system response regulator FixJ
MSKCSSTVFLVDDDTSFLASLNRMLRTSGYTVASFTSAEEFFSQRPTEATGCIVADLQMPGMDGMALQKMLAQSDNPLPIVFLSGNGDIPTSVQAMRNGAEDFLTKTTSKEELLAAIERALARDARDRMEHARKRELLMRFGQLTPRENEVLTHVLRGQLNKQIAADLGINERSIKRHRTSLMRKLGVNSVAELAQLTVVVGISEEFRVPGDRLPLPTKDS